LKSILTAAVNMLRNRDRLQLPLDPDLRSILAQSSPKRLSWLLNYHEKVWGGAVSSRSRIPLNGDGSPLPWYTYAAIAWLDQLDFREADVFEYGSGNSSRYWAARARRVISVESDAEWYEKVKSGKGANQDIHLHVEPREYAESILREQGPFRVVVVDGLYRYDCASVAIRRLHPGGLLILDNSDWHPATCVMLRRAGLVQVDFMGPGPINAYAWCTSVFLTPGVDMPRLDPAEPIQVREGLRQVSEYDQSHL
jgi:hypothetical protein